MDPTLAEILKIAGLVLLGITGGTVGTAKLYPRARSPGNGDSPSGMTVEVTRALGTIDSRLAVMETKLGGLEKRLSRIPCLDPATRVPCPISRPQAAAPGGPHVP